MTAPRYGRDRNRLHHNGVASSKRANMWYLLSGGFVAVYFTFLIHWRFGDFSYLEGMAPTEQLRKLRKASQPVHVHRDDALDVGIAARQEEQQKRALQIPIKLVLPMTPTAAPIATAIAASTEELQTLEKIAVDQQQGEHDLVMPAVQVIEAAAGVETVATLNSVAAAIEPVAALAPLYTAAVTTEAEATGLKSLVSRTARNQTISGYAETMKFLGNYQYNPDESLFLFFVCSDELFQASDWSDQCVLGKENVYDVFSKSPERNRLVTVFAGSEKYWKYSNDFYDDRDLKVKGVPSILQWEGRSGRTSGMLVQRSLYDVEFLEYLFLQPDQPKQFFTAETVKNKQIVTLNGYDAYVDAMTKFEEEVNPGPTFLMLVAGRFQNNKRPWCPYCRFSELPLEYAFYSFAPKDALLIRVEVTDSYTEWNKRTEFTDDPNLQLQHVPLMIKIEQQSADISNTYNTIKFVEHKFRYDRLAPLREFFTSYV